MQLFIVICIKDRHDNLKLSLDKNIKFFGNNPVVIVDASDEIYQNDHEIGDVTVLRANRTGQFNQKIQACEYLRQNFPDVSHVLFLDDDIHLDRNIDEFIHRQYKKISAEKSEAVLTLYVDNLQKMAVFEFLRVHSFQPGRLSRNTFTSRNCIGYIKQVEWALGGCSCWPIKFCPVPENHFPISGKAYTEDIFLSILNKGRVKFYSSDITSFKEVDLKKSNQLFLDNLKLVALSYCKKVFMRSF